jgi:hypothetical protein
VSKVNRLKALKSRLDSVQFNQNNTQRRVRTRTLIQMGGLLNMVGLAQLCGIAEGDDLQLDLENQDKAATLLGILSNLSDEFCQTQNTTNELEKFKLIGIKILKDNFINKKRF